MAVTIDGTVGVTTPAIVNANGGGVGNIGTSAAGFNTVFASNGAFTTIEGTLTTAAQPNITSFGALSSLSVAGNITAGGLTMPTGNATIGNLYVSGVTTIAGNIQQVSGNSGQFFGNASTGFNALYAGLPAGFNLLPQSVVNFASSFDGYSQINNHNQDGGQEGTTDYVLTADNGDDSTFYVDLGIAGSGYTPSVAELNNALGNALGANDGYLYVTGNPGTSSSNFVLGTPDPGAQLKIINGGSTIANISAYFNAPNQANTLIVVGGVTCKDSVTAIDNSGSNGVGNIGTATSYFNTVFAKSTSAQYADLAEKYLGDAEYAPGTVVVFGGSQEVTQSTQSHDPAVAGVISTNPSYLMNSGLAGEQIAVVALMGRVPCKVVGQIRKGDLLTTSLIPGVATKCDKTQYEVGCVVGKALEIYDSQEPGIIEIAVGRL